MEKTIQHEKYGLIVYRESFWTGKPTVSIGGTELKKVAKKTFEYVTEDQTTIVSLQGNMLKGVQLVIGSDTVTVQEKSKWYEYALSLLIFIFILVWGNVPALVAILPLIGGAIGGLVSGIFAILNLLLVRKTDKIWLKLLIFVGCFALTVLCCYLLALAFIAAFA